jgi:Thermostable hemolysin
MPIPCPVDATSQADPAATARRLVVVGPSHPLRPRVEACIAAVYERAFGARDLTFPELLIARLDAVEQPIAAAGIRTAADGFFSEAYLDAPIERLLSDRCGVAVARTAIFEVTTLASRRAAATSDFVRRLAALGKCAGFGWSFFTATGRLRLLLRRLGMPVLDLAPADRGRLPDAARWGSYYAHSPLVCAVSGPWPAGNCAGPWSPWPDA